MPYPIFCDQQDTFNWLQEITAYLQGIYGVDNSWQENIEKESKTLQYDVSSCARRWTWYNGIRRRR
jgi:hypothetical protein